jgi:two-component system chemotaxis response regulator CheB
MSTRGAASRVLVCEDAAGEDSLSALLGRGEELEVVGVCASAEEALAALERTHPDLVALDLELAAGGPRVVAEIMRAAAVPLVALSVHRRGSEQMAAALAAGALEVVPKSQLRLDDPDGPAAVVLRHRLRRLARATPRREAPARDTSPPRARLKLAEQPTAIGICASTGGPGALATILGELPAGFPLPVLVAQHMADGFIDSLVGWIAERSRLPVAVVRHKTRLRPGIWFAPDDANLVLDRSMHMAVVPDRNGGPIPSADVLLTSMAAALGAGAIGVVLTGMGRDGGRGVAEIAHAGGCVIAQDQASSVVFGMPKTAIEQGASVVLPLEQIAPALRQLVSTEGRA